MKHKYNVLLLLLLVLVSVTANAQLPFNAISSHFKPFTSLRVIKTERFDIIFPKESEASARILASYADDVYKELSSLLGIEVTGRIPVTFAPHTDLFNGYYNPVSRPHIILYDTPMDLEWTNFPDNLKGLFIHELAHAISLNTRGGGWRWLHRIFGNWAAPALFNAPYFMIEGVTISMESLTGFGRANDPLIKQKIAQAIHEGKFPSPLQASGVYDLPGQGSIYYDYGGLFSAWLQQNYGMEKYAELWQVMGRNSGFSFSVYRFGYYRIFKKVYGIDFMGAWNAFRDSLTLNDLEENHDELFPNKYHFFSERRNFISALAGQGDNVFVLDRSEEKIRVYNTLTEEYRAFNTDSVLSYDLDVSADAATVLVSGYRITAGDRYRAVVTEHRADSGRKTGRAIQGLYKARYFRDGVIGIRSEQYNTNIVFEDFNGNTEILFRGDAMLLFSGPQAVDNERIVFIAAREGLRELLLYNYVNGELFRIESSKDDNDEDDSDLCFTRYMRGLGVSEGKLFFSHNTDDRMYKLAAIDLESMQAVFSDRDFSGGVFYPVSVGGEVYYRGAFLFGDGLLRFPEKVTSMSGTRIDIRLVKLNKEDYGVVSGQGIAEAINQPESPWIGASKPYFSLPYMNPFNFWFPLPLLRINQNDNKTNISLDGGGLLSVIMDPTDRHFIMTVAYADITYRMAMVDSFSWQTTVTGFPITLAFSDKVLFDLENAPYRDTQVTLGGSFMQNPGSWAYGLSLGAGYIRTADDNGEESAYLWEETTSSFFYYSSLAFSNLRRRQTELFGTGLSLSLRGISFVEKFEPRVEGLFRVSAETRFPVNLALYGAYDARGMTTQGTSRSYGAPIFAGVASSEYPHPSGLSLSWIAGAEVSLGLFSFEIQRNFSHAYFNRLFGTLSARNVMYDSKGNPGAEGIEINDLRLAQSLMLRMRIVSSFIPLKVAPVFIEPTIWGAWKFSNTINCKGSPWNFGFAVNLYL